jgi:hypothetical protein
VDRGGAAFFAGQPGKQRLARGLYDIKLDVRVVPTRFVAVVTFNDAGQAQQIVVNHRPRSALLSFSRVMLEKLAGSPG